jgi:tRNA nucleotidyltransferase/poly(A) polymerase
VTGPEAARRLLPSALLRRLASNWTEGTLFLTGGSLRDRLLRLPTRDLDLAVLGDGRAAGQAFAQALGGRCFPIGRPPLVTWRVAGGRYTLDLWEIAADLESDILRRDFTVNALFWRLPRGPLLDLVGGLDDLEAGRIRVVRPENLVADPLRVLRGTRLLATHPHLRLTAQSEQQLGAAAARLRFVARERVAEELRMMLAGPGAERALAAAIRVGAMAALLPSWEAYPSAPATVRIAGELAALQMSRGNIAAGAREVAAAVLAAPAAGHPAAWDATAAASALAAVGWPSRRAQRVAAAAALGERLVGVLGRDPRNEREVASEANDLLAPAVAWAVARAAATGAYARAPGLGLIRWGRRLASRPPLLSGDEIAELLSLPPGPERAEAAKALRLARARGEVSTRAEAERFLRQRSFR